MSYQISLKLDQRDVTVLEKLLNDLRLTSPFPSSYADSATLDIPDSMPLPPNPQSLLSSIVRYPFPMRYLLEGLLSQSVVAPEDLTILIGQLAAVPNESPAKREKLLASLFSMGPISGRIQMVVEGAAEVSPRLWSPQALTRLILRRRPQEARRFRAGQAAAATRRPRPTGNRHADSAAAPSSGRRGSFNSSSPVAVCALELIV
jgi:hypothetical protein